MRMCNSARGRNGIIGICSSVIREWGMEMWQLHYRNENLDLLSIVHKKNKQNSQWMWTFTQENRYSRCSTIFDCLLYTHPVLIEEQQLQALALGMEAWTSFTLWEVGRGGRGLEVPLLYLGETLLAYIYTTERRDYQTHQCSALDICWKLHIVQYIVYVQGHCNYGYNQRYTCA